MRHHEAPPKKWMFHVVIQMANLKLSHVLASAQIASLCLDDLSPNLLRAKLVCTLRR